MSIYSKFSRPLNLRLDTEDWTTKMLHKLRSGGAFAPTTGMNLKNLPKQILCTSFESLFGRIDKELSYVTISRKSFYAPAQPASIGVIRRIKGGMQGFRKKWQVTVTFENSRLD